MNFSVGLRRFCRFCVAGLGNTAMHYVVAWSALAYAGLAMPIANLLGCAAATLLSYFVNALFVFREPISARKLARFALVNAVVLAFAVFVGIVVAHFHWPISVAVVMTSAFGITVGFVAHSFITFRRTQQRHTP